MSAWKLYHNPRCSKSRKALEILREKGVEPELVLYLKDPPGRDEIAALVDALGGDPEVLLRKKEKVFTEKYRDRDLDREGLIDALATDPVLIERPVAVREGRAVVGRPPERVLELI